MTMMGELSDAWVARWIDDWNSVDHYVSLHWGMPGTGDNELVGGSYTRVKAVYAALGNRATANKAKLRWASLAGASITHLGIYGSSYSSDLQVAIALDTPYIVVPGQAYEVPAQELYLRW